MPYLKNCKLYYEDSPNYLVEYRGNFKEQIDQVSYACGDIITNTIAVVSISPDFLEQLQRDVPSIVFIDFRRKFVLQDVSPSSVDNINAIKINPYLDLSGRGVLVGIIDTGIDYLNEEFIREDDTSRILSLWDQTIPDTTDQSVHIGRTYTNEELNSAIQAYRNNQDPYAIVPSRDDVGHGTQMAGIIGARGVSQEFQGVASGCDFVIVKLLESIYFRRQLEANGVPYTPIYNTSEILPAVEYLKNFAIAANKPIVIYIGVGTTQGTHDSNILFARYLTFVATYRGIIPVAGVGNEGASEGHASGSILQAGGVASVELRIPREIRYFSFSILVVKPNRMSLNVVSPNGEESNFIKARANEVENIDFVFLKTKMTVRYYVPEQYTGHEVIEVIFDNIKPGIWTFQLRGDYITDGKYHIWLPPQKTLPEGTRFLQSDPFVTLTIPSTARNVATVAYYGNDNALIAASGKGFSINDTISNPDISTIGVDILTTKVGGGVTTVSGSSAAAAIIAGACALLLQWGIVNRNDQTMFSQKVIAYLIHGADRTNPVYRYPSRDIGYGYFDLLGTFNVISRSYRQDNSTILNEQNRSLSLDDTLDEYLEDKFHEYYVSKLFIRIPKLRRRSLNDKEYRS